MIWWQKEKAAKENSNLMWTRQSGWPLQGWHLIWSLEMETWAHQRRTEENTANRGNSRCQSLEVTNCMMQPSSRECSELQEGRGGWRAWAGRVCVIMLGCAHQCFGIHCFKRWIPLPLPLRAEHTSALECGRVMACCVWSWYRKHNCYCLLLSPRALQQQLIQPGGGWQGTTGSASGKFLKNFEHNQICSLGGSHWLLYKA